MIGNNKTQESDIKNRTVITVMIQSTLMVSILKT